MSGTTVRCKFVASPKPAPGRAVPKVVRSPKPSVRSTRPFRTARMLALAHHIERLIDEDAILDFASAARVLGLTRARVTQVMNLLLLAPDIQVRIATGELVLTERALRRVGKEPDWRKQVVLATPTEEL